MAKGSLFLNKNIDIILTTHPDSDHVAALPTLFEHHDIGRLITNGQDSPEADYQELLSAATSSGTPIYEASVGDVIIIDDGVQINILDSADPRSPIPDPHLDKNSSIALILTYGSFSLLITGDAGAAAERDMMAGGNDLASIVYKAGHHGSDTSSSLLFLNAVAPDIAVVSSGVDNQYGHPHPAVLGRLSDAGAAVLGTDELGSIVVITDGQAMWWESRVQE